VIFYSNSQKSHSVFSRHVCIFAEGELDRSPTGTGVSARAALEFAKGRLKLGQQIKIESIYQKEELIDQQFLSIIKRLYTGYLSA